MTLSMPLPMQYTAESPSASPMLDHVFRAPRISRLIAAYVAVADGVSMNSPVIRSFLFDLNRCDPVPPTTPWDHPDVVRFAVAYDRALDMASMRRSADAALPPDVRDVVIESCAGGQRPSMARLRAAARIVGLHDAWTSVIPTWSEAMAEQFVAHLSPPRCKREGGDEALSMLVQRFPTTAPHLFAWSVNGASDVAAQIVERGDAAELTVAARTCRRDVWLSLDRSWRDVFRAALASTPDGAVELMRLESWDRDLLSLIVQSPSAARAAWRLAMSADGTLRPPPEHWCTLLDSACADPRERVNVIDALTREQWNILPRAAHDVLRRVAQTDNALLGSALARIGSDPILTPLAWNRPYALTRYYAFVPRRTWLALPEHHRHAWIAASRRSSLSAAWSFRLTGRRTDDDVHILHAPHACLAAIAALAGNPHVMSMPLATRLHMLFWYVGRVVDSVRSLFNDVGESIPLFPDVQTEMAIIPDADDRFDAQMNGAA